MNKGLCLSGPATSFFALTGLLYNSLFLAVRECTKCINHISFKLELNSKIERYSFMPQKAGSGFYCSVSPAVLIHSTLFT